MPHSGTNWNLRTSSVSWVGPGVRHFEHRPRQRFLGRTLTWSCLCLPTVTSLIFSYRKPLCFSTELSRVLTSTGRPSLGRLFVLQLQSIPPQGPGVLPSLMADRALKGKLAALGAPRPLTAPPSIRAAPSG